MENSDKTEVLIIDNDVESIKLLGDGLGTKHSITIANNGEAALEFIESAIPDIILLDNTLPPVNSFDICSLLKSDPTTKDIPIILLTKLDDTVKRSSFLNLGAVDYIIKPIDFLEARVRVNMHVELLKSRSEVKDQGLVLSAKLDERTSAHAKELDERTSAHAKELDERTSAHAKELDESASAHAKELDERTSAHAKELDESASADAKELDDRSSAHENEIKEKARAHGDEIKRLNDELKQSMLDSVKILVGLIEGFDSAAGSHVRRVYTLSKEIAEIIGLTKDEVFEIEVASLLHELGKFCIPESLRLRSYNQLTPGEIELIKQQTVFSQNVLLPSKNMHSAAELIRSHLERYDGSGFPDGLVGEDIPFGARVIGIANAYDTLINSKRFDNMVKVSEGDASKDALAFLKKSSGTYYDPKIIKHLDKAVDDISRRHGKEIRVSVEGITPGYILSRNLYTSEDKLLLSKDVELTSIQIEKLKTFLYARQIDRSIYVYKK